MEDLPYFHQYRTQIQQIHDRLNTRTRHLFQEQNENTIILRSVRGILRDSIRTPGTTVAVPVMLTNLSQLLTFWQAEITREIHQIQRTIHLFHEPSNPPFILAHTNLDLFNFRAAYLIQISTFQEQVDQYADAID
jgi:hypothetical protein